MLIEFDDSDEEIDNAILDGDKDDYISDDMRVRFGNNVMA